MSEGDWFAAKRFGYGAGMPIAWQGWVLLGAYVASIVAGARWLAPRYPLGFGAVAVIVTLALVAIVAHHIRGGWRWRWGSA